jgi:hypothetical protein
MDAPMKINNPKAVETISTAIKRSELDCCDWQQDTCRELAMEILVALAARSMFVVEMM